MIKFILLSITTLVLGFSSYAQDNLKGIILEYKSNETMPQVVVKNINSGDSVSTNNDGAFNINVKKEDILVFSYPGYRRDSLVVIDFAVKRVYLTPVDDPRMLEEVNITALTNNRLAEEKERVRKQGQFGSTPSGGGIGLSPSRIFGREGREARRQYRLLEEESNNRIIDTRFNEATITELTPLSGEDLTLFMAKYRPKVSFVEGSDDEQMRLYIMDAYNKYKELSPSAKEKIKLTIDNKNGKQ
ncbi:hypothetical protein H8S90_25235 [Olivibacter sp. SDN3]|uniref:hypothetical protein n=1 Tax=Olivibacter sp. SDN3 TaxID=2764720 RepID=UPI001651669B|nr:hypothetical protein [Olivibacter sp. SDN3]QNL49950.1 hypothetical protein H8S90_25235 [Olivibacter sp. SDN3]